MGRDPSGPVRPALARISGGQAFGRIAVIEHHLRPAPQSGDCSQRRRHGFKRQIGNDAEPHEGRCVLSAEKTRSRKTRANSESRLEIDRSEKTAFSGNGDARLFQPTLFPDLRRRMIDFENSQPVAPADLR